MAALAQRLLTGLMAEPLCVPFNALASGQLPRAHPNVQASTQRRQQQQQQKVHHESGPDQQVQPLWGFSEAEA
eukprot:scaffold303667_cov17-Tisochrysis_lutea.AAC.1